MAIEFARKKNGEGPGSLRFKNWMPVHNAIVMDRIAGMTLDEVAEKYNYEYSMISQICNSRNGRALVAQVNSRVLEEKYENFSEERKALIIKAADNLRKFLYNDELHERAPLLVVDHDRKILETLNNMDKALPSSGSTTNIQVNVMNNPEKRDRLAEGLAEANRVRELHSGVTGISVGEVKEKGEIRLMKE
jgi:hypothetical protein